VEWKVLDCNFDREKRKRRIEKDIAVIAGKK